jgi:hypothetical protein
MVTAAHSAALCIGKEMGLDLPWMQRYVGNKESWRQLTAEYYGIPVSMAKKHLMTVLYIRPFPPQGAQQPRSGVQPFIF